MRGTIIAVWLLAAALFAAPAAAQPDPAAYGPLTICIGGYSIAVEAGELALLDNAPPDAPGRIYIRSDRIASLRVGTESGQESRRPSRSMPAPLFDFDGASRIFYPKWTITPIPGDDSIVWGHAGPWVEYNLPATKSGAAIWLSSRTFVAQPDDLSVFDRVRPRTAATRCDTVKGTTDVDRDKWSPALVKGPGFLCNGRLGITLLAGETAQHEWADGSTGLLKWKVNGPDYLFEIRSESLTRIRGRPVGNLLALGYRIDRAWFSPVASNADLKPPENLDAAYGGTITLYGSGSAVDEELERSFASRLELIAPGDKRCAKR